MTQRNYKDAFYIQVGSYFDNHLGRVTECKSHKTNTMVCLFWSGHQKLTTTSDAKIFESEREAPHSTWPRVQPQPTIHPKLCCPKILNTIINLFPICMQYFVIKRCTRKKISLLILDVLIWSKNIIQFEMTTLCVPLIRRFSFESLYGKILKYIFKKKEKILQ